MNLKNYSTNSNLRTLFNDMIVKNQNVKKLFYGLNFKNYSTDLNFKKKYSGSEKIENCSTVRGTLPFLFSFEIHCAS